MALAGMVGVVDRDHILLQELAVAIGGTACARGDHRVVIVSSITEVYQHVRHGITFDKHAGPNPLCGFRAVDGQPEQVVTIVIGWNVVLNLSLSGLIAVQLDRRHIVVGGAICLRQRGKQVPVIPEGRRIEVNVMVVRAFDDVMIGLGFFKTVSDAVSIGVRGDRHGITVEDAAVCELSLVISRHPIVDIRCARWRIEQARRHRISALISVICRILVVVVETRKID